jgi:hypothetical protein
MKRISKPDTAKPANPAAAGFGRDVDAAGLRLVRRSDLSWREALLSTAAAGALSIAIGGPALAGPTLCVTNGAVATCSGDQSAGIASGTDFAVPLVTTLNVNNLTTAITPASGTRGISFTSTGAITISSDTGAFGISALGNNASGIFALSTSAGAVTVTSTGNITAQGILGFGILAESIGAAAVTVTSTGNIATQGSNAYGIFARSSGAGAVTLTSTGNITTRGSGASGIAAVSSGAVTVTSTGNISTQDASAYGIFANSTGAGAVAVASTGNITTQGSAANGIFAYSAGPGAVTVTSTGNIATQGFAARGIFAFSAGAGAVTVTSHTNIATAGTGAYGIYAISHLGAAVMVTSSGNITTQGQQATGISARGTGTVTVTSTGNITTTGNDANGILAGSLGAVTVTSTGNITAAGNNAAGILAVGNSAVAVTINSGTVSGGSGTGAGVSISGGTTNTLTNLGAVTALSGLAIQGDTGNNTVNNFGTVIGNVILGSGTNAFNNMAGGFFNAGATVNLGAGNTLTNAGTLSPGGAGVIQTTALTGNLVQSATGRLLTDINVAGATSDRINVSGTANLAGAVQLQVQNLTFAPWQQTLPSAAGGVTNNGLSLTASPALQAQLVFPDATDVVIKSAGLNFAVPGLNNNQTAVGNALNGAGQTAGLGAPVFNLLLNTTSVSAYGLALTQLSGEGATGTQQATFDAMSLFMGTMLDPFSRGTTSTPGGGVSGYASEGDASAYTSDGRQRSAAERAAYAMVTKAPPQDFAARWNVWAAGFGGSQTTDAMPRWEAIRPPAASLAAPSGPTTCSRRTPWPASRSPAAAPILSWPTASAPAAPTCSRPAPMSGIRWDRPTSRPRWPMAGRMSPPTAP